MRATRQGEADSMPCEAQFWIKGCKWINENPGHILLAILEYCEP